MNRQTPDRLLYSYRCGRGRRRSIGHSAEVEVFCGIMPGNVCLSVSLSVCSPISVCVGALSASVRELVSVNAFDTHAGRQSRRAILIGAGPRCRLLLLLLLQLLEMHQSFNFETV